MILVTGATGHIGRELVRVLDAAKAPFRLLVRDLARATDLPSAPRFAGDLGKPDTLPPAFAGVTRLFLLTQGIGIDYATHALAAAKAAGIEHIVFVSSYATAPEYLRGRPLPAMARWHHAREELLRSAGIPATILRPGGFMTNAFDWLPTIREGSYVFDPIGPGRFAPIDPADIAAVAARALLAPIDNDAWVLTGSESLTVSDQVAILSATLGRHLDTRPALDPTDMIRARFPNGAPPALAEALLEGFRIMQTEHEAFRTDTVSQLLGRPPATFAAWCTRNAAHFRVPAAPVQPVEGMPSMR